MRCTAIGVKVQQKGKVICHGWPWLIREVLPGERGNFNSDALRKSSVNECKQLAVEHCVVQHSSNAVRCSFLRPMYLLLAVFSCFARDISSAAISCMDFTPGESRLFWSRHHNNPGQLLGMRNMSAETLVMFACSFLALLFGSDHKYFFLVKKWNNMICF